MTYEAARRPRLFRPMLDGMEGRQLLAVAIQIRYDYDTTHFFDTQAKKDLMQQVADQVGAALDDHLAAISPSGSDTWTAPLVDPTTGEDRAIDDLTVPADTILVYVGGRALGGNTSGKNNGLTSSSSQESPFEDQSRSRGKPGVLADPPTAYAPWGGSISFDNSHTDWYFGQDLSKIGPDQVDFSTVATHELGHLLGIGTAPSWQHLATAGGFTGPASEAANGGKPVPLDPGQDHWDYGTGSDGTWAAMTPVANSGRRTAFSDLDYAALKDIGWSVAPPPRFQFAAFEDGWSGVTTGSHGGGAYAPAPEYFVDGASGMALITVTRLGPSDRADSVNYKTFDGVANSLTWSPAAVAGTNYSPTSGVLDFAPGETTKTFAVPVADDGSGLRKGVGLALSDPSSGALLGSLSAATLIIRSQFTDPPPPVVATTTTTTSITDNSDQPPSPGTASPGSVPNSGPKPPIQSAHSQPRKVKKHHSGHLPRPHLHSGPNRPHAHLSGQHGRLMG